MSNVGFSVIIPLFNKASFIRQTLVSALAQHHPVFDVIVVDDASTDGSADRISDLVTGRVRLIHQENGGPGMARNRGASEASSDWLAFLDGDDLWLPNHLSTLADLVRRFPSLDVVASGFRRASRGEVGVLSGGEATVAREIEYFEEGGGREVVWTSATAVRRATFEKVGGFGAFWPGEDIELWARLALRGPFAVSNGVTAIYTMETGGLIESGGASADFRASPTEEPVFRLVEEALSNPAYAAKYAALRHFRSQLMLTRVKPALYSGETSRARSYLAAIDPGAVRIPRTFVLLSRMPGPVLRTGARLYSMVKRRFRRL